MKNTEKTKKLIEEAIRFLPDDFALRDARYYMVRALSEIGNVEKKRAKRSQSEQKLTPRQKWEFDLQTNQLVAPILTPIQRDNVIARINNMIEEQEQKIRDAQNKDQESDTNILTD